MVEATSYILYQRKGTLMPLLLSPRAATPCSEPIVVVGGSLGVADLELDLCAFSELFNGDLFGVLTLDLSQQVESGIEVLGIVFVGVGTKFVMVHGGVLPLLVGLNVQKLHEAIEFHLVELVAEVLAVHEVLVFERLVSNLLNGRVDLFLDGLFLATLFGAFFFGSFFAFFATFFFLLFFFLISLSFGSLDLLELSMGLVSCVLGFLLNSLDSNEGVVCWPGLLNNWLQQAGVVDRESASDFVETNESVFVISHVERCEQSVHEVIEIVVTWVNEHLLTFLHEITNIEEFKIVVGNANITDEVAHLTIGGLIQVGENTIFELRVLNVLVVSSNFVLDGKLKGGLVAKNITELSLVNGHALLVSVIKLGTLESVAILGIEVFLLRELGKFLFNGLVSHLIQDIWGGRVTKGAARVANLMKESLLFLWSEVAEVRHQLTEIILDILQSLVLCLREKVENTDEALELRSASSTLVEKLGVDVVLVIKLGDLCLSINDGAGIIVPVIA